MAYPSYAVYTDLDFSGMGLTYAEFLELCGAAFRDQYFIWVSEGKTIGPEYPAEDLHVAPTILRRYWINQSAAEDYSSFCTQIITNEGIPRNQYSITIFQNIN